jgi:hypothetical protein
MRRPLDAGLAVEVSLGLFIGFPCSIYEVSTYYYLRQQIKNQQLQRDRVEYSRFGWRLSVCLRKTRFDALTPNYG